MRLFLFPVGLYIYIFFMKMNNNSISVHVSLFIAKPREVVWDFTQTFENRTRWDSAVTKADIIQLTPVRIVRLKMKGNTLMTVVYKLDDRPNKTTLAATEVISPFIVSGGGSWVYEEMKDGTLWTQNNTIKLKEGAVFMLLIPFFKWIFKKQTMSAMRTVKRMPEASF
jgi:polyketide cyclase/dehydrase/lipid transport protein